MVYNNILLKLSEKLNIACETIINLINKKVLIMDNNEIKINPDISAPILDDSIRSKIKMMQYAPYESESYIINNNLINHIVEISVYSDVSYNDAIDHDQYIMYYSTSKKKSYHITSCRCKLTLDNNQILLLGGLTCGYRGTGPRTLYDILLLLGVSPDMANNVYSKKICIFKKQDDNWVFSDH